MPESGWTKGPWGVYPRQDTNCLISGFYAVGPNDGPPVAYVFGKAEAERLAAAPAMAEALEEAEEAVRTEAASLRDSHTHPVTGEVDAHALPEIVRLEAIAERARSALSQARGEPGDKP